MSLYEVSMRVRIRDRHQDTPKGLWGKEGEIFGVDNPLAMSGEYIHPPPQVYSVLFDGDTAPMNIFEAWLELA